MYYLTLIIGGLLIGCLGAWATNGWRLFFTALGTPVLLFCHHLVFTPTSYSVWHVIRDYILMLVSAYIADYMLGLKLGRNDKAGYRSDSVGH